MRLKALVTATTHNTVRGQADEPGQRVGAEDQRQIENAHSTGEQHRRRDRLHRKLQIRTCAVEIVVDAETRNQAGWDLDVEKGGWNKSLKELGGNERQEQPQG